MKTHHASPRARRRPSAGAFSLVELVVVITITGIIAAVAISTLSKLSSTRNATATRLLVRDLTYARERAIATGTRTWVVFNAANETYTVKAENPASPGKAGATAIQDPASTGRTFVQTFGAGEFAGVGIVSATFDSGSEIGFDWVGKPYNSAETALASAGAVALTGSCSVTIQPGTGIASYTCP